MLNYHKIIKLGDIDIQVRISLKAKHIGIRISPTKIVELILPKGADFNRAYKFLIERELWIKNKLGRIKISPPVSGPPKTITILGHEYELVLGNQYITEPIKIIGNQLLISHTIPNAKVSLIITPFLKKIAKIEIIKYTLLKAQEMKLKYQNITIRDTTSRWGSCSSKGNLSFSWRLILAPQYVMEYVIVHELCHLLEMNHSHRFWKLVNAFFPQHHLARTWLKKNGKNLHSVI